MVAIFEPQFTNRKTTTYLPASTGPVFMKGLRLSQVLGLNPVLKLDFCLS